MEKEEGRLLTSVLSAYSEGWRRRGDARKKKLNNNNLDNKQKSFFREAKPKPRDEDTKNRYDVDNDELDL